MAEAPVELYNFGAEICESGHTYGPAVRDHYLIHCILRGKGTYYVGEKAYSLHAGQAFLILPGIVTTYSADKDDPWEYVWMGFNGSDSAYILNTLHAGLERPILTFSDGDGLQQLIAACEKCSIPTEPLTAISYVYSFLAKLNPIAIPPELSASETILNASLSYLKKNFSYDISIEQLAQYIGISRSQLYRIFIGELGVSPKECLIQIRLHNANRLLATTNLSVSEVMYSCGYADISNFSKQFKQKFGVSPSRQRQTKI